ncbi:MAG: hypothetical protein R2764_03895 [Bacteroidales bacterium]
MGYVPETLQATVDAALETGNNMGIPTQDFIDTLKWLEEDLQFEVNDDNAAIPINEKGKTYFIRLTQGSRNSSHYLSLQWLRFFMLRKRVGLCQLRCMM